ncbi:hypothetical protein [Ancylobacter amanitiformis]|uniref:Phasin domain-containing protein n=1 Tax=Ancylobacter amanitiformis TaxID=217069 RepID=A0ABU0LVT3_9HYPH|nr:hypothetical protein [Ancylobacter amanitiformis]MDQ0512713.1 hypothetical protein [Ancylobacter amanitiformis]
MAPLGFDAPIVGSPNFDALRDAMDQGTNRVKDAGAEAGQAFYDAASRGADLLDQASSRLEQSLDAGAARLEQGLRNGAAAISSVKVQVAAPASPAARPGPNANLGRSMPDAGMPGSGR